MSENNRQLLIKLRQCNDDGFLDVLKRIYADGYAVAKDDKDIDEEFKDDLDYWSIMPDYLLH